jgi:hypothetical protein
VFTYMPLMRLSIPPLSRITWVIVLEYLFLLDNLTAMTSTHQVSNREIWLSPVIQATWEGVSVGWLEVDTPLQDNGQTSGSALRASAELRSPMSQGSLNEEIQAWRTCSTSSALQDGHSSRLHPARPCSIVYTILYCIKISIKTPKNIFKKIFLLHELFTQYEANTSVALPNPAGVRRAHFSYCNTVHGPLH